MFNATVTKNIKINDGLFRLFVQLDQAPKQPFLPGQYTTLGLPELQDESGKKFLKRAYSICSSPQSETELEFFIAKVEGGELTPRLFSLNESDRLLCGPKITGTFNLSHVPKASHLILVGTGTGLAPFMSMLRTKALFELYDQIDLINGVRYETDFAYLDEIESFSTAKPEFRYHPIVSRPKGAWNGQTGRIQKLFLENQISVDPVNSHTLLCGNPAMIEETKTLLESMGCKEHTKKEPGNIHIEKYW
jgi:ferredoxin--NADP+ reductase